MTATCSQWLLEPYGAPTSTSEISSIAGFYSVEALTAFGRATPSLAGDASAAAATTAESAMDFLAEVASQTGPGTIRPAI